MNNASRYNEILGRMFTDEEWELINEVHPFEQVPTIMLLEDGLTVDEIRMGDEILNAMTDAEFAMYTEELVYKKPGDMNFTNLMKKKIN